MNLQVYIEAIKTVRLCWDRINIADCSFLYYFLHLPMIQASKHQICHNGFLIITNQLECLAQSSSALSPVLLAKCTFFEKKIFFKNKSLSCKSYAVVTEPEFLAYSLTSSYVLHLVCMQNFSNF